MSRQLPPRPEGRSSGFPYSILWEEFAEIWEGLDQARNPEERYEALLAEEVQATSGPSTEPSLSAINETIQPLQLAPAAAAELAAKLYRIAAAYRIPHLMNALGYGAGSTKAHLRKVAATAVRLADLLESSPLEQEVVLGLLRRHVDAEAKSPSFHFKDLINEAKQLSATATMMADEIPQMPRGTSANVLQARLMEAATRVIGEAASDYLEVLQADTAGRNPRPKSTSARVLFKYLKLVDRSMTDTTIVRLFPGHNYGPKRVTMDELKGPPPKQWPLHVARRKLTR